MNLLDEVVAAAVGKARMVPGPSGPEGPVGPPGRDGRDGDDGQDGRDGATGPAGPVGPEGPEGREGREGPEGPPGEPGPEGPAGPRGPEGPVGRDGADGRDGLSGPVGSQGPPGEPGPEGPEGPAGDPGRDGRDGTAGPAGPIGQQGDQGPEGPRGLVGPEGPEGAQGPPGPEGQQGEPGSPGTPGGPRGLQGQPGPEGPVGPRGDVGPTGAVGPQGEVGPEGPEGPVGPLGPRGEVGPQGAVGPQGVNWRGPWRKSENYSPTDVVEYKGTSYIATTPSSGTAPPGPAWEIVAARGEAGSRGADGLAGPPGPPGSGGTGGSGAVDSVNGQTDIVVLAASDIGVVAPLTEANVQAELEALAAGGGSSTDAVWHIVNTGTGGSFDLGYVTDDDGFGGGEFTVAWNDVEATIQGNAGDNVTVAGNADDFTLTFVGAYGGQPMTVFTDDSNLTGGSTTPTLTTPGLDAVGGSLTVHAIRDDPTGRTILGYPWLALNLAQIDAALGNIPPLLPQGRDVMGVDIDLNDSWPSPATAPVIDFPVVVAALTSTITVTLPDTNTKQVNNNLLLLVEDSTGVCSPSVLIRIVCAGSDTIVNAAAGPSPATEYDLRTPYASVILTSPNVGQWQIVSLGAAQAAFVNPLTATPEAIALAMIATGLMAAS